MDHAPESSIERAKNMQTENEKKKRIKLAKKTVKHLTVKAGVAAGAAMGSQAGCSDVVLKRRIRCVR
jgi:hypothetical protein